MIELTVADWSSPILVEVHNQVFDSTAEYQKESDVWIGNVTVTDSNGEKIEGYYQKRHSETEIHKQEFRVDRDEIEKAVNDRDDIHAE